MYRRDSVSFPDEDPEEHITIDVQPRPPSPITRLRQSIERGDPATRNLLVIVFAVGMLAIVGIGLYGLSILLNESNPPDGPPVVPTDIPGETLVIGDPGVDVPPVQPVTLTINGQSMGVYTILVQEGVWTNDPQRSSQAAWVYGTLINYLFGLDAGNEENVQLLELLIEGDPIIVHLSNGRELEFIYRAQERVPLDNVDLLQQTAPGVTLVLLREGGEDRLIARGDYNADVETGLGGGSGLGQPIDVWPVRVTAQSGELRPGPLPGLPEGRAYYLVNFDVENLGDEALDTSEFQMRLTDAEGRRYNLSLPASQQGLGPLPPLLEPGEAAAATAGFLVPDSIQGPVTWEFHVTPGSEEEAQAELPVQVAVPTATPQPQADVLVTAAGITDDGFGIVVRGLISNVGGSPVTVTESDVSLTVQGAPLGLRETAAPLPWTIAPGGALQFALTFERPAADTALLSVLGRQFQLVGLR